MAQAHKRNDISDKTWTLIEPHLMGRKGTWGGNARDNRQFINAVMWILRTGAPWRDLPTDLGDWKNTQRRFCRWRDKGAWEGLLEILMRDPNYEWLIIDANHIKAHQYGCGAADGNQDVGRTKESSTQRYTWPWMRLVCRSEWLLLQVPSLIARRLGG